MSQNAAFDVVHAFDHTLDALGKLCPWPLLLTKEALKTLEPGQVLRVLADDPLAELDIRSLCERTGQALIDLTTTDKQWCFWIRKLG
jgi:tRNA 2-thiouridine synthesizing protein A